MEDRGMITWKQFQKQTKHGMANDTKHTYKLGLRSYNTDGHMKKAKKVVEVPKDCILGSDPNARPLLRTLLSEHNVSVGVRRYKNLMEKYENEEGLITALFDEYGIRFGVRYVSPDSYIDDKAQSTLDTACIMIKAPKNDPGFYIIEEI